MKYNGLINVYKVVYDISNNKLGHDIVQEYFNIT